MAKANGTGAGNGSDTEAADAKDAPLLDLNEASVKKLLARAKKRGYITYDELNEALPQDQMSSEQIEDIMSALSEMGINIIENDEPADDPAETARAEDDEDEPEAVEGDLGTAPSAPVVKAPLDRTDVLHEAGPLLGRGAVDHLLSKSISILLGAAGGAEGWSRPGSLAAFPAGRFTTAKKGSHRLPRLECLPHELHLPDFLIQKILPLLRGE